MSDNKKLELILEMLSIGQYELANAAGCDRSVINRAIKNQRQLSENMKVKITQAINKRIKEHGFDSRGLFD